MIELTGITKTYHGGRPNEFTAVNGVSLAIGRGTLTVLMGPSGSGKTTLLTLLGCMARPTAGRIVLRDLPATLPFAGPDAREIEITSLPERFLNEIRRTAFGFIFQQFNLIRGISVLENVMLPAYPVGIPRKALRRRAGELLELFDIARHAGRPIDWLSGGELQRVAIARALINDPALVIADEPTAHLDTRLSAEFMDIVARLKAAGKTIVIASHDPIVFDSPLADARIAMRDGVIVPPEGPA